MHRANKTALRIFHAPKHVCTQYAMMIWLCAPRSPIVGPLFVSPMVNSTYINLRICVWMCDLWCMTHKPTHTECIDGFTIFVCFLCEAKLQLRTTKQTLICGMSFCTNMTLSLSYIVKYILCVICTHKFIYNELLVPLPTPAPNTA